MLYFQTDCVSKPFYMSVSFYFAVGGWCLLSIVVGLFVSFKCKLVNMIMTMTMVVVLVVVVGCAGDSCCCGGGGGWLCR